MIDPTNKPNDEAELRAYALLLRHLTPEQRAELPQLQLGHMMWVDTRARFTVRGSAGGTYHVPTNQNASVRKLGGGTYCIQTPSYRPRLPHGDVALTRKLLIETDEPRFLRCANRLDPPLPDCIYPQTVNAPGRPSVLPAWPPAQPHLDESRTRAAVTVRSARLERYVDDFQSDQQITTFRLLTSVAVTDEQLAHGCDMMELAVAMMTRQLAVEFERQLRSLLQQMQPER